MESPTTIKLLPLEIAPTASLVGICEASSNMTMSNLGISGLRYCAQDIGDIKNTGKSFVKIC